MTVETDKSIDPAVRAPGDCIGANAPARSAEDGIYGVVLALVGIVLGWRSFETVVFVINDVQLPELSAIWIALALYFFIGLWAQSLAARYLLVASLAFSTVLSLLRFPQTAGAGFGSFIFALSGLLVMIWMIWAMIWSPSFSSAFARRRAARPRSRILLVQGMNAVLALAFVVLTLVDLYCIWQVCLAPPKMVRLPHSPLLQR